ncbi:NRF domain-containing protein [Caerostris darwini]|uniref:NRF domain-containing protein n=1 Tax=Caerostris darwini TaxID=1538125 RepID=A0AAV4NR24_9ARAC|nr:NRF domain-containing protein [Caerostris darwini]
MGTRYLTTEDETSIKKSMVDSSGRLPSGTLEGTLTDLGDYDQCLDVVQPKKAKHMDIQGQYCTLEVQPVLPELHSRVSMNTKVLDFGNISTDSVLSDLSHGSALFHLMVMRIGVCVPSPCVADDIQALSAALLKKVPVQVSVRNCEIKQEFHVTIPQFIVISITLVIIALITAGTAIDSYVSRNASNCSDMGRIPQSMLAFSLTMNLKKLMKSSRRNSSLGAVNGVRCLSLLWIVLAHTYGFGHRQGLGGLLVASSNLKIMESTGGKINYFLGIHRVWRLIPPLTATVGIMFILPLIGSGPLWAGMAGQKGSLNCERIGGKCCFNQHLG